MKAFLIPFSKGDLKIITLIAIVIVFAAVNMVYPYIEADAAESGAEEETETEQVFIEESIEDIAVDKTVLEPVIRPERKKFGMEAKAASAEIALNEILSVMQEAAAYPGRTFTELFEVSLITEFFCFADGTEKVIYSCFDGNGYYSDRYDFAFTGGLLEADSICVAISAKSWGSVINELKILAQEDEPYAIETIQRVFNTAEEIEVNAEEFAETAVITFIWYDNISSQNYSVKIETNKYTADITLFIPGYEEWEPVKHDIDFGYNYNHYDLRDPVYWQALEPYMDMIGTPEGEMLAMYPEDEESGVAFCFTALYTDEENKWCCGVEISPEIAAEALPSGESLLERLHNDNISHSLRLNETEDGSIICYVTFYDATLKFTVDSGGYMIEGSSIGVYWTPCC